MPRQKGITIPTICSKDRSLFPVKLYCFLTDVCTKETDPEAYEIIRWSKDGLSFQISNSAEFESIILPKYFNLDLARSFHRQLNLYGFRRTRLRDEFGKKTDSNIFQHDMLQRGKPELCKKMRRNKVKAYGSRSTKKCGQGMVENEHQRTLMVGNVAPIGPQLIPNGGAQIIPTGGAQIIPTGNVHHQGTHFNNVLVGGRPFDRVNDFRSTLMSNLGQPKQDLESMYDGHIYTQQQLANVGMNRSYLRTALSNVAQGDVPHHSFVAPNTNSMNAQIDQYIYRNDQSSANFSHPANPVYSTIANNSNNIGSLIMTHPGQYNEFVGSTAKTNYTLTNNDRNLIPAANCPTINYNGQTWGDFARANGVDANTAKVLEEPSPVDQTGSEIVQDVDWNGFHR